MTKTKKSSSHKEKVLMMSEYYKDKQSNIYKLLFTAQSIGVQVDFQAYVLEDAKEEKFFCTKYEFDSFKLCNPPVDWHRLYNQKVVCLIDFLGHSESVSSRYEEIKNKILPYTLKRLARYQTNP